VWVAISLSALVTLFAIVFNVAYWYVVQTELQTAADAAALRGAEALQIDSDGGPDEVPGLVIAFASNNYAQGDPVDVANGDIRVGYVPAPVAGGQPPALTVPPDSLGENAVEVTAAVTGTVPLRPLLSGSTAPRLARQAIAWIGNINGARCVQPWTVPMSVIMSKLLGSPGQTEPLTQHQIVQIGKMQDSVRTIVLGLPRGIEVDSLVDGTWGDVTGACRGPSEPMVTVGDELAPTGLVGDALADEIAATMPALGSRVLVVYGTGGTAPGEPVTAKMIGYFVVTCFVRVLGDVCPDDPDPTNPKPYAKGTIKGYIEPTPFTTLDPDLRLGAIPSIAQRLLLVR
jgi:hypothetical protein